MKYIYTFILLFLLTSNGWSQRLVSFEFLSTTPRSDLNQQLPILRATNDVDLYRVIYMTPDALGIDHEASGLVCVPVVDQATTYPLACYQHGTVQGRNDVPSMEAGGHTLTIAFCARGYVVATPDFVGLGISPGVHPYVHADTEASAAVDLLLATQEMMNDPTFDNIVLNDQLFISGYSQGGHAAMALHRAIELDNAGGFEVTASAPMSGPYSVSDAMVDFTLSGDPYETVSYIGWLTLGYQVAYPNLLAGFELEDVFLPQFIPSVEAFRDETILLNDLNSQMSQLLLDSVGSVTPVNTLRPEIADALINDPDHPLSQALADNDVFDWAPQAPTNLYYCMGDEQVTFRNATLAAGVMTANGSDQVTALQMDVGFPLTHGGCVLPASLATINFFDGFRMTSSTIDQEDEDISIFFADNLLHVDLTEASTTSARLDIYNTTGISAASISEVSGESRHSLDGIESGFYFVVLSNGNRILKSEKIAISK